MLEVAKGLGSKGSVGTDEDVAAWGVLDAVIEGV
jgi:hypothetical protein